jgi:concentrative nucleoside transporter, CNT family
MGIYNLISFAGISVGSVSALAPAKTPDVSSVVVRALIAAAPACLQTACVAGTFYTEGSILFG